MKKKYALITGLLLLLVGGIGYFTFPINPYSPLETDVIQEATHSILLQIPAFPEGKLVWVLPLRGDESLHITRYFTEALDRSGKVKVLPSKEMDALFKKNQLNPQLFANPQDAKILLNRFQIDGIFIGEVRRFLRTAEQTQIELVTTLVQPTEALEFKALGTLEQNFFSWHYLKLYFSAFSFGGKSLLFLLGVGLIPLFGFPLISFLLKQEHNGITFLGLGFFVGLDIIWITLLFGGLPNTWYGISFFLLLTLFGSIYTYGIFTEIQDIA